MDLNKEDLKNDIIRIKIQICKFLDGCCYYSSIQKAGRDYFDMNNPSNFDECYPSDRFIHLFNKRHRYECDRCEVLFKDPLLSDFDPDTKNKITQKETDQLCELHEEYHELCKSNKKTPIEIVIKE